MGSTKIASHTALEVVDADGRELYYPFLGVTIQRIRDAETEARELQKILHSVGTTLRANSKRTCKAGITYAEFKARRKKRLG